MSARRIALCLLLTLVCASVSGCGDNIDWAAKGATDEEYPVEYYSLGEAVYEDSCASCHGAGGSGSFGPQLRGKGHKYSYEDQRTLIERGRRSMPGFASSLSSTEIDALLAYIRVGFFINDAE